MTDLSRNMFEGISGVNDKNEQKSKGGGKAHPKKKDQSIIKPIEYSEKESSYINKYLKIAKNAYDEKEIYEIVKKYNFDDDLISKEIKRQLNMIQVRGDEYGWSEVKKKEIKPKENSNNDKETINKKLSANNKIKKDKKKETKDFKGKIKGKNFNEKNNKDKKERKEKKEDNKEKQGNDEEYVDDEKYYEEVFNNDNYDN